ncbi:MAG TPA: hypothetical protein VMM38_12100 [Aridibacter sp.]|nr:hypothetical protein [Aridibacter sp.]
MQANSHKPLFTIILDWNGGTYVYQVRAGNASDAALRWTKQLDVREIPGFGEVARRTLNDSLTESELVSLDGLENVWCMTALIRGKLALVNIVCTLE